MDLPLDRDSLVAAVRDGRRFHYRFFWGHRQRAAGVVDESCLSQWWPCSFEVHGHTYTSAEQFMMAGKARLFGDAAAEAAILAENDPAKVKALGRTVRKFDPDRWMAACFDIVTEANVAKFGQDQSLGAFLMSTGDAILVEASPVDPVWGIGLKRDDARAHQPEQWQGTNLLGFALCRARAILTGQSSSL